MSHPLRITLVAYHVTSSSTYTRMYHTIRINTSRSSGMLSHFHSKLLF